MLNQRIYTRLRTHILTKFCKTDLKQQHIKPKLKDTKRGGPWIILHSNAQRYFNSREIPSSANFFTEGFFYKQCSTLLIELIKNFFVEPKNI